MKSKSSFFLILLIYVSIELNGQTPITAYQLDNSPSLQSINTSNGFDGARNYSSEITYRNFYGTTTLGEVGNNREIISFTANRKTFKRVPNSEGAAFDALKILKNPRLSVNINNILFESDGQSGNDLYYVPEYIRTVEQLMNSYVVNRGINNVFANQSASDSNIERIDLLNESPSVAQDINRQGFLVNERDGNNHIKIAAIIEIDSDGNPRAYGSLKSITPTEWGRVGPAIATRVMSRNIASDPVWRPEQDVGPQIVSGCFISLAELDLKPGDIFYGFSLFPFDITSSNDLITLSDFPINTDAGQGGGADLLSGSGFFYETPVVIEGTIFFGNNTNLENKLTGLTTDNADGSKLYAHLVDTNLKLVVNRMPLQTDGTYSFLNVLGLLNYNVYISTVATNIGQPPSSPQLPADWYFVGENQTSFSSKSNIILTDGEHEIIQIDRNLDQTDFGIAKPSF